MTHAMPKPGGALAAPSELLAHTPQIRDWLTHQLDLLPGFGWLDGGCLVLAMAFKQMAERKGVPVALHAFHCTRPEKPSPGPDHFVARPLPSDQPGRLYFDGDGFATLVELLHKMQEEEGMPGYLRPVPEAAIPRILADRHYWYNRRVAAEMADRIDELFGPILFPGSTPPFAVGHRISGLPTAAQQGLSNAP